MWGKDKELLRHKDKKLHHQQKPSPTPVTPEGMSAKWVIAIRKGIRGHPTLMGNERGLPPKDSTVSPPHFKSRREE